MRILVTGGAGYIGSVVTQHLVERGHEVTVLDNLSHGWRGAVHPQAQFRYGDLVDREWLRAFLTHEPVEAVVHLAAEARIDDSIRDPGLFYRTNIVGGIHLLDAMVESGVKRIIFSSTAAVYGEPQQIPITEEAPTEPVNAYGESKLAFEKTLHWYHKAHDIRYVSLRYFNACGATEMFGEARRRETHIIPLLFDVALGRRDGFHLFGTDYDTPDGTCVRDYVHVSDIAQAHVLGLSQIDSIGARAFNIGSGRGFSNQEVITMVHRVTGKDIRVVPSERRLGDPARLVAASDRIRQELGWQPQYADLESIVGSAWEWRERHPAGYSLHSAGRS